MPDARLVMVDRVEADGSVEAEAVVVMPLPGGGRTLVLDDGTQLRFHATDWAEVVEDAA